MGDALQFLVWCVGISMVIVSGGFVYWLVHRRDSFEDDGPTRADIEMMQANWHAKLLSEIQEKRYGLPMQRPPAPPRPPSSSWVQDGAPLWVYKVKTTKPMRDRKTPVPTEPKPDSHEKAPGQVRSIEDFKKNKNDKEKK